ncbi:amino acid adenylation domain-containing protein [Streptomyces sp. NPDC058195]|uniref:amino acid adenylation domain-containing protein n=1 Tax=Streptomyces sp. NPDC058195 TaxID=3346375 RepID=UPI0036EAF54B
MSRTQIEPDASGGLRLPLSFPQRRLWLLHRLDPDSTSYNMSSALRLRGPLDERLLQRAVGTVLARHEILRTTFPLRDGEPVQLIQPSAAVDIPRIDVSALPPATAEHEARRTCAELARSRFDLTSPPLLRLRLVRLGPADHILAVCLHHIVADGWSLGVFAAELSTIYTAFARGRPVPLPPLPAQYADFTVWQRGWLQGAALESQVGYWQSQLDGLPPTLRLPADRARPPTRSSRGGTYRFALEAATSTAVHRLCTAHGVTPYMVLMAALQALLARLSDQDDFVLGTVVANRTDVTLEPLIGFFVNTLPVRADVRGTPTFTELLARVRTRAVDALAHQDLPFEILVDRLHLARSSGHNPLFDVLFVMENAPAPQFAMGELDVTALQVDRDDAKFDLTLFATPQGNGFDCAIEYSLDLFDTTTAVRLARQFERLLGLACQDPWRPVTAYDLLTAAERRTVLVEWNRTLAHRPAGCLPGLIAAQARATPQATAVQDGDTKISYRELMAGAGRVAAGLQARGVGPGDLVAVRLPRSPELIMTLVAVLATGAAYVPVDPGYPEPYVRGLLADCAPRWVVTDRSGEADAPRTWIGVGELTGTPAPGDRRPVGGGDLAYVIYTSGSTGRPKGVLVEHGALANVVTWIATELAMTAADRVLLKTPIGFDASARELYPVLVSGGTLVLAPPGAERDPRALAEMLRDERITAFHCVPSVLSTVVEEPAFDTALALRAVMCGGENLSRDLALRFTRRSPARLYNVYGPTEATVDATFHRIDPTMSGPRVPIGQPIPNTLVYLLDDDGRPVPVGMPGRVHIGGAGVARGYLNDAALTAAQFVPDGFCGVPGARMYVTGDRARYRADGALEFLGRDESTVKVGGVRVAPCEVEHVLRSAPDVADAAVVSVPDGAGQSRLQAYIVAADRPDPPLDPPDGDRDGSAAKRVGVLRAWRHTFDALYCGEPEGPDELTNTVGWRDSYRREPIPDDEMREWIDGTLARVRRLDARDVLELGCGTGLLLLRLAPACRRYVGLDFSAPALAHLRRQLRSLGLDHVDLHERAAHDLGGLNIDELDAVVLNSVIQYFPSGSYLARVLDRSRAMLRPTGALFVGDVRDRRLGEVLLASVALRRAPDGARCADVYRRIAYRSWTERELLVDPGFFTDWAGRGGGWAQAELKPGRIHNELTRFRYDVTIRLGSPCPPVPSVPYHGLAGDGDLVRCLRASPDGLRVTGVPNARLRAEVAAHQRLRSAAAEDLTVGELRRELREANDADAVDPWALIEQMRGDPPPILLVSKDADRFDVLRPPAGWPGDGAPQRPARAGSAPGSPQAGAECWTTAPRRAQHAAATAADARRYVAERLPSAMVPAKVIALPTLPRMPHGKLDRRALTDQYPERPELDVPFAAPTTPTQIDVARVVQRLLGIDRVGQHDNFFQLGGHSLLGTQLVSRLRELFGVDVKLVDLFESPTVAGLARVVQSRRGGDLDHAELIPRRRTGDPVALSFAQERLWFLDQLHPGNPVYTMAHAIRLSGGFDLAAFRGAVGDEMTRQASLRTRFVDVEGRPTQVVDPPGAAVEVPLVDLTHLPADERDEAARGHAAELATRPFDLARGPLLRLLVLRLAPAQHLVVVVMHHIVADGWSMGVLVAELAAHYTARVSGVPVRLTPLTIDYTDYAVWQREWLRGPVHDRQWQFWRDHVGQPPPVLRLPTDFPRPEVARWTGETLEFTVDAATTRALTRLGEDCGTTLFMVLLAGLQVLLHQLSGQTEFVVGTVLANRHHRQVEPLIGFFVNAVPLRAQLSGQPSFRAVLERVRTSVLGAQTHQDFPFERLLELLDVGRDSTYQAVFQVLFALQNAPMDEPELTGLTTSRVRLPRRGAMFDLSLEARESGGELRFALEYSTTLYRRSTATRLADRYVSLLLHLVDRPTTAISRLPLMPAHEARQARLLGTGPAAAYTHGERVEYLIEHQVRQCPGAVALSHGGDRLSYDELWRASGALAAALSASGVVAGDRVGVCVPRGPASAVAILGVLRCGAAFVVLDPEYPSGRLGLLIREAGIGTVVTGPEANEMFEGRGCATIAWSRPGGAHHPPHRPPSDARSPAYLTFTSGSTGQPKGVLVPAAALCDRIRANQQVLPPLSGTDRFLHCYSFNYDGGIMSLLWPLATGATVVFAPLSDLGDGDRLAELVVAQGITVIDTIPAVLRGLFLARALDHSVLRHVITGGEAVPADVPELVLGRLDIAFSNQYGPSEAVVNATSWTCDRRSWDGQVRIGRPLPNTEVLVLDGTGRMCPIGVPGELYIGGRCLALGYLNDPDATASRFVRTRYASTVYYRSGDKVRLHDDGQLEFVSRLDRQVQIRAMRVELGEIESVLSTHPKVAQALVTASVAHGQPQLVAYVMPHEPEADSAAATARVRDWAESFQTVYTSAGASADAARDFTGWDSTSTGAPLPRQDMDEWLDATLARIRAVPAAAILEVGCGMGLLTLPLAAHCRRYTALDISARAVQRVTEACRRRGLDHVDVRLGAATDLAGVAGEAPFDLVILNSVVQYFPSRSYLRRALADALRAVAPGGHVFVGDVRAWHLSSLFQLSLQLAEAEADTLAADVRQAATLRAAAEDELTVAPSFFTSLGGSLGEPVDVQVSVKRGWRANELTDFRYDVLLRRGTPEPGWPSPAGPALAAVAPDQLAEVLATGSAEVIRVGPLANARTDRWARVQRLLAEPRHDGRRLAAVLADAEAADGGPAVHPEELWRLGAQHGYRVNVLFTGEPDGSLDAVFVRADRAGDDPILPVSAPAAPRAGVDTNAPMLASLARQLRPALLQHLERRLPRHMVPTTVVFLDTLPAVPGGKTDPAALPVPSPHPELADPAAEPPLDVLEAELAEIEADLLGLPVTNRHAEFFGLGGHSLLAAQLVARIRAATGVDLPVQAVFRTPTVAGLAAAVRQQLRAPERAAFAPVPASAATGNGPAAPLSFGQEELWHRQGANAAQSAQLGFAVRLRGRLQIEALAESLTAVLDRHSVLRTRIAEDACGVRQRIVESGRDVLHVSRASVAVAADVLAALRSGLRAPLDLRDGGPLGAELVRISPTEHVLLLRLHAIAVDGASARIVLTDLASGYAARVAGVSAGLARPLQYPDLAAEERRQADAGRWARLPAWRTALADYDPLIRWPDGAPAPASEGRLETFVGPGLLASAREACRGRNATVFAGLLGAYAAALGEVTGQRRLVVGVASAARSWPQLTDVVGPLAVDLPVGVDLDGPGAVHSASGALRGLLSRDPVPTPVLTRALGWRHEPGKPAVDASLSLQEELPRVPDLPGVQATPLRTDVLPPLTTRVRLSVLAANGGLRCSLRYRALEPAHAQALLDQFRHAFTGEVCADAPRQEPPRSLGSMP